MSNVTVSAVEEFRLAWFSGMESLLKACKIYVEDIDKNPESKEEFKKAFPKISATVWSRIEGTGRGQIHYLLFCDSTPAADKLRKLPYSEQQRAIDVGFEVLTDTGSTLKVKTEDLTPELTKQVFARDHIRDIAAQKAYRESLKIDIKLEAEKPKELWTIKRNELHIYASTVFTREQLAKILHDMC